MNTSELLRTLGSLPLRMSVLLVLYDSSPEALPHNSPRLLPEESSLLPVESSVMFEEVSVLSPLNSPHLLPAESSMLLKEMSVVFEEANTLFEEASSLFETSTLPIALSTTQTPISKKRPHGDKVFFDDDYTAGPRQISHQLAASAVSELEWEGLLEHAEQRARQETAPGEYEQDDSEDDNNKEDDSKDDDSDNDQHRLERMGLARLWRVAEGYEETAPIVRFKKILKAGWTSVTSVFGRVSCPGWIFVKAKSISDAQKVCQDVSDVYVWQIYPVPPEQAGQYLLEPPLFVPRPGSFVHLDSPPLYHGNLAYVLDYNYRGYNCMSSENHAGAGAGVLVVPCIERFVNRELCMDQQKRRRQCPTQQVLPLPEARRIFGNCITVRSLVSYVWKSNRFEYGFLVLDSQDVKPAIVTHKELEFFRHSGIIPPQALAAVEDEIAKSLLREGDLVMVHRGEMSGGVGRVIQVDVDGNEALVHFESSNVETFIHTSNLRKSIKLGDCVSVVGGNDNGRVGWVVGRNASGELALWDDATQMHRRPDLSQASLVDFNEIPDNRKEAAQAMEKLREENHKKYMNRHVRIVGKHPLKDYEGIVREILYDDKVKVKIAVTLKREEVHLSHLADRDDPNHLPFLLATSSGLLQQEPREAMEIPLSNMPLTLSTPIPVGSSAHMSPAWNPSSHTPNPSNPFLCNPYIQSPYLDQKLKIKIRVHNTKPILDDPGFWNGDFEGLTGLWKVGDHDRHAFTKITFTVPKSQGGNYSRKICDSIVTDLAKRVAGDKCHVRDHEDRNKKNFCELPTGTLVVVLLP
ncbi:hypothetical protein DXG01_004857 [Tephrocybe rancida]|nr:hypothetical protein DXG01_004857 [Tephrocybe rancida]